MVADSDEYRASKWWMRGESVPREGIAREEEACNDGGHHAKTDEERVSVVPASEDSVLGKEHDVEEEQGSEASTSSEIRGEGREALGDGGGLDGRLAVELQDERGYNDEDDGKRVDGLVHVKGGDGGEAETDGDERDETHKDGQDAAVAGGGRRMHKLANHEDEVDCRACQQSSAIPEYLRRVQREEREDGSEVDERRVPAKFANRADAQKRGEQVEEQENFGT